MNVDYLKDLCACLSSCWVSCFCFCLFMLFFLFIFLQTLLFFSAIVKNFWSCLNQFFSNSELKRKTWIFVFVKCQLYALNSNLSGRSFKFSLPKNRNVVHDSLYREFKLELTSFNSHRFILHVIVRIKFFRHAFY